MAQMGAMLSLPSREDCARKVPKIPNPDAPRNDWHRMTDAQTNSASRDVPLNLARIET